MVAQYALYGTCGEPGQDIRISREWAEDARAHLPEGGYVLFPLVACRGNLFNASVYLRGIDLYRRAGLVPFPILGAGFTAPQQEDPPRDISLGAPLGFRGDPLTNRYINDYCRTIHALLPKYPYAFSDVAVDIWHDSNYEASHAYALAKRVTDTLRNIGVQRVWIRGLDCFHASKQHEGFAYVFGHSKDDPNPWTGVILDQRSTCQYSSNNERDKDVAILWDKAPVITGTMEKVALYIYDGHMAAGEEGLTNWKLENKVLYPTGEHTARESVYKDFVHLEVYP